jgi:hypothetical protein
MKFSESTFFFVRLISQPAQTLVETSGFWVTGFSRKKKNGIIGLPLLAIVFKQKSTPCAQTC